MGKQWKQWETLFLGGSKITADGDCSHEIKRRWLLGRKAMTNLDSILKNRDITGPTKVRLISSVRLVAQSCLAFCDPMDCRTPGLPVHHQLPSMRKLMSTESVIPSNDHPLSLASSCLQSFPASGSFQMRQFFTSGGQSIGVSVSASVLPMNIQDWFPLGLTYWISLQSKGLSRVFSNTIVQKHQFFGAQHSL